MHVWSRTGPDGLFGFFRAGNFNSLGNLGNYATAPEVRVEIGGSYGAFTMLQVGMKVQIVYRVVSGTQRDVIEITQIPDNFTIEEA